MWQQCIIGLLSAFGIKETASSDDAVVSLLDFQAAIKSRHRVGTSGIGSEDPNEQGSTDFA